MALLSETAVHRQVTGENVFIAVNRADVDAHANLTQIGDLGGDAFTDFQHHNPHHLVGS